MGLTLGAGPAGWLLPPQIRRLVSRTLAPSVFGAPHAQDPPLRRLVRSPQRHAVTGMIDERRELLRLLAAAKGSVPPHPNEKAIKERTFGERVADAVARGAGSWPFILGFVALLAAWLAVNTLADARAWDPAPFILLNLVLSCVAALQAPIILMSQNRQGDRDRLQADLDYHVNIKAELEIAQLRVELAELRRAQWQALLALQSEQIVLLRHIASARDPSDVPFPPSSRST